MIIFHLVYKIVRDPNRWYVKATGGLIGAEDIFISFIYIVALVGIQHLTPLLSWQQMSLLPTILSGSPGQIKSLTGVQYWESYIIGIFASCFFSLRT